MIRAAVLVLAVVLAAVAGCSRTSSPPRVEIGTPCATCGMAIQEIRFAGLLRGDGGDRPYDSIECLVKGMTERVARAYLSDYDQGTLHAAESVWVVKGDFPTPMGGGLAAFVSLESAREVASQTHGQVLRLTDLSGEAAR